MQYREIASEEIFMPNGVRKVIGEFESKWMYATSDIRTFLFPGKILFTICCFLSSDLLIFDYIPIILQNCVSYRNC